MNKIDCIIPFVDLDDAEWFKNYQLYLSKNKNYIDKEINHDGRFRDNKTLKYLLRSLDLYAPWINNVYLVVQRESQVPKWINRDTVKVVLHEEFIPKEFLPIYNGLFLQLFFHNINGLSENYICIDDDMIVTNNIYSHEFFNENKIVQFIKEKDVNYGCGTKGYFYPIYNAHKITCAPFNEFMFISDHGVLPFNRKMNEDFYKNVLLNKLRGVDKIIRGKDSIICWVYLMNNYKNRRIIVEKTPYCVGCILNKSKIDYIIEVILYSKYKVICINDYDVEREEYDIITKKLLQCLNIKFKNTCKYER